MLCLRLKPHVCCGYINHVSISKGKLGRAFEKQVAVFMRERYWMPGHLDTDPYDH